ncbi:PREDICTED: folate transporter 1 [Cariama cristata]|uniref:folate transporter 1 n=1 Tax=Cariama cristata TaxID=54380 RepID=UPI0005203497|nr:PREDICTED: folate transporter 1 [Cariama cristata]
MPKKDDDAKKLASETVPDQRWKLQVFYLCFYGFMVQIRPGESFITPYLLGVDKNFTQAEVSNVITPVLTYSYMAVLVPIFLGVFTSSVLGQLCVTLGDVSFLTLNYISLGFVSFGLVLTLFLERPQRSLFFNRPKGADDGAAPAELDKMAGGARLARQPQLRLWSLWWIFNSAGYYLMLYYVQILWNEIYPTTDNRQVYNGGVDAASTLLGAGASFAAGYLKIRWTLWSELVIGVVTAFQAGLLLLMNTTSNIWLCYTAYVLFRSSYQFLVPIATFQIASSLSKELCALVFGMNTFFGTVLKTIITIIVADKRGLGLSVHPQFYVYFGYFTLLAVVYLLSAVCVGPARRKQPAELALAKEPCQLPAEVLAQEKSPEADAV